MALALLDRYFRIWSTRCKIAIVALHTDWPPDGNPTAQFECDTSKLGSPLLSGTISIQCVVTCGQSRSSKSSHQRDAGFTAEEASRASRSTQVPLLQSYSHAPVPLYRSRVCRDPPPLPSMWPTPHFNSHSRIEPSRAFNFHLP